MKHDLEKHKNCNKEYCSICVGGLALCTVCGGAEMTLTTDCCERPLTEAECDLIINSELDFKNRIWVRSD